MKNFYYKHCTMICFFIFIIMTIACIYIPKNFDKINSIFAWTALIFKYYQYINKEKIINKKRYDIINILNEYKKYKANNEENRNFPDLLNNLSTLLLNKYKTLLGRGCLGLVEIYKSPCVNLQIGIIDITDKSIDYSIKCIKNGEYDKYL